jgi:DNA-binding MarR family transcriptional regulator
MEQPRKNSLKNLLYTLVRQAKADIEARFAAARVGVTPLQYGVLCAARNGKVTLNEMARTFVMRPPSLVPAVNFLERGGLIRRTGDARDRRKTILTITKKGLQLIKSVQLDDGKEGLSVAFKKLSAPKQKQLLILLQDLTANFPR